MPVIGVESMVTRASLRNIRDYLAPVMCSLIKPAAVEKLMLFPAKIHIVMLLYSLHVFLYSDDIYFDVSRSKPGSFSIYCFMSRKNGQSQWKNSFTDVLSSLIGWDRTYVIWDKGLVQFWVPSPNKPHCISRVFLPGSCNTSRTIRNKHRIVWLPLGPTPSSHSGKVFFDGWSGPGNRSRD